MSDRILNFSEFFKKYSKESNKENSLDTIINSPQNFEDGFDETTYDKTELGPNKPVSQNYATTPASPKFKEEKDETMEAPSEEEAETPEPEKMGANPKKEVEAKEEKPTTDKKVTESRVLSFAKFAKKTNEDVNMDAPMDRYAELAAEEDEMSYMANPTGEDVYEEDLCPNCGKPMEGTYTAAANPGMKTCGGNPMKSCGANPY